MKQVLSGKVKQLEELLSIWRQYLLIRCHVTGLGCSSLSTSTRLETAVLLAAAIHNSHTAVYQMLLCYIEQLVVDDADNTNVSYWAVLLSLCTLTCTLNFTYLLAHWDFVLILSLTASVYAATCQYMLMTDDYFNFNVWVKTKTHHFHGPPIPEHHEFMT